jgi:hypothetical protein
MTANAARLSPIPLDGWHLRPLAKEEAALVYPLLLALDGSPEPLSAWQALVREWLRPRRGVSPSRGIMTLRNARGVIAGVFFFEIADEGAAPPIFLVPLLRVVEPIGGWRGLTAALGGMEAMARELGCASVVLTAEPQESDAWQHTAAGLEAIGRTLGFVRASDDWFQPLHNGARVVSLPSARL